MTTLQLARAIADAVLEAGPDRQADAVLDRPTNAVLEVLHRTSTWFVLEQIDDDGVAISGTAKRLPNGDR